MLPLVQKLMIRQWEQVDLPAETSSHMIQTHRPSSSKYASDLVENAEQVIVTHKQLRSRVRDSDDGSTEMERQEVVFTETRTTWPVVADVKTETTIPHVVNEEINVDI